ncbi:MAG: S46 family peptidase, partial [Phocaeicola sp.]
ENVPLQVKKHLTINLNGVKENDFTFVMGFPGRNFRYMISDEVEERMETVNFMRHKVRDIRLSMLKEEMLKSDAVRIQYANKYASTANYWKNAIGMNQGLIRLNVLDKKRIEQERLLNYGDETANSSYREAFDKIRQIVASRRGATYHQQAIYETMILGTEFVRIPATNKLLDALKDKNESEISLATIEIQKAADLFFNKDYNREIDRKVSKKMLQFYTELIPAEERISIFETIAKKYKGDVDSFVDDCFNTSIFRSREALTLFLQKPNIKTIEKDLMIRYAQSVKEGYLSTEKAMMEETKAYNLAHKIWVKGMMELKEKEGTAIYPDANATLRLTYGKIGSYEPADGAEYLYYTTLKGVMEKEDPNNPEFVVPAKLKQLYEQKDFGRYARKEDGEMPVCFITGTDNTGGNSGSPIFNAKGELIGTGFDRNWEGLAGDIAFQPKLQRAACVDIRYTLFIIEKFAGAKHLIDEMTIIEDNQ